MKQYVVPNKTDWGVRSEGSNITRKFTTQEEAIQFAHCRAKEEGSEVIIHGKNGRVSQRQSTAEKAWTGDSAYDHQTICRQFGANDERAQA